MALTMVMELNGSAPDFAPAGSLELKAWVANNQGIKLPPELDLPLVQAMRPTTGRSPRSAARSARSCRGRS